MADKSWIFLSPFRLPRSELKSHFPIHNRTEESQADGGELQAGRIPVSSSIARVAHDGKTGPVQMAADLVASAGAGVRLENRAIAARIVVQHPVRGMGRPAVQRLIEHPSCTENLYISADHNPVVLVHTVLLEHFRKGRSDAASMGQQHQPAGLTVEPVDQVNRTPRREMTFGLAGQGTVVPEGRPLAEHARRFVPDRVGFVVGDQLGGRHRPGQKAGVVMDFEPIAGLENRCGPTQAAAAATGSVQSDGTFAHGVLDPPLG